MIKSPKGFSLKKCAWIKCEAPMSASGSFWMYSILASSNKSYWFAILVTSEVMVTTFWS